MSLCLCLTPAFAQTGPQRPDGAVDEGEARLLEQGHPIKRELGGGRQHSYRLRLSAGQFVKAIVDQQGIDVAVRVFGLDGAQIIEFDSEKRPRGQEQAPLAAEAGGDYQLVVQSKQKGAAAGSYEIRIEESRAATETDRELQTALILITEFAKLYRAGNYDEALQVIERALEIRERILGPDHQDVAIALNNLAQIHSNKGEYAKAEPLLERALAILEKALGPEDHKVVLPLNNLAIIYFRRGDYTKAEQLCERALTIREKALGPEHVDVADSLNNLAAIYTQRGEHKRAEPLFRRALSIKEKALGPDHPNVAVNLNNLAFIYWERGDYAMAESFAQQAMAIWERALGREHPDVAMALNTLANIYGDKGDYAKSEPLYQRALEIWEKTLGREHPNVAIVLNNLANTYYGEGERAKAEPLYRRALEIYEKALGPESPDIARPLSNLANVYLREGDYAKAEPLFERALAIREKTLGPESANVAASFHNLANLYGNKGEYDRAEPLYQRARTIFEKALGPQSPNLANTLNSLAEFYAVKGDTGRAIEMQSRANDIAEYNLALNLGAGSERQKLAYLAFSTRQTDFTFWLHTRIAPDSPQALELAFTILLRQKGRGLDAMTDTVAALRRRAAPQDQMLFDQLIEARSQLAALILKEPDSAKPEDYRARVKPLEERIENLEAELGARSAEFRAQAQPVTLSTVQAAIPAGGALVEFVVYTPQEPLTGKKRPPRYLAYLLAARGRPKWVDLGEAAPIERAVDAWRESLRENSPDVKRLGRAVDELVMRPVRSSLRSEPGPIRHLLIAPDGPPNLIPFAALVDEENRYLIERYTISYLTSGRDLLRLQNPQPSRSAPLILADPLFGPFFERTASGATRGVRNSPPSGAGAGDQVERQSDQARIFFQRLPGTKREALAIKAALPEASLLLRQQATEAALKRAKAPSILHIATHGFFFSSQEVQGAETPKVSGGDLLRISDLRLGKWAARIESPLLRSGLALAGANRGKGGDDDGLLTALEVAGLDLWGTKLVALSACDTGLGEIKNGEGVQGLRRALVLAGSESQVISLWAVPDEQAKDIMVPYYKALRRGEGRAEGLRQVQLRMLRSKDRRHPFYWAAFIQSGEWANLNDPR